ncbi:MAG TPA: HDIG domain-containing protein [Spirochaetota bacterium]|nr:HDIG domain-containing protein [Spirochaetota bacterium]HPQ53766.1 HDIG domain-containing protein [Spirochaetota bacterium]
MKEINAHTDIPMTAENRIPDNAECYQLIQRYEMLPNIVEHSEQVARVALAVTDDLIDPTAVDRELIRAASLLHDITKTRSLTTKERHDITGAELLRTLGFEAIAYIVEQHVYFTDFNPGGAIEEREIVYYADKRVMHDVIVTVDQRVEDLVKRYGITEERRRLILQNKKNITAIEEKINRFMKHDINDVIGSLDSGAGDSGS